MADLNGMYRRASTQLGLVARADLEEFGITRPVRRRQVDAGTLVKVGRATYAVAAAPRSRRQQVMAACLDTGGVASHRTSAWLHGLEGFAEPTSLEVTVRRASYSYERTDVDLHTST